MLPARRLEPQQFKPCNKPPAFQIVEVTVNDQDGFSKEFIPSTGITRLQRYYEPLRHPRAPGLSLTGFQLVIADHASGLPVLRALSLCTCCRQYPGAAAERIALLTSPSRISLPRNGSRVGLRIVLFEACSAFTRVTACTLALSPYIVTRYPKASATSSPP